MSGGVAIGVPSPRHGSSTAALGIVPRPGERKPSAPAIAASGQPALGEWCLRPSRSMIRSAAAARMLAVEDRGEGEQQPGDRRRRQVQQIVEPRRRPAECPIARRFVPDHAVERVRHLVGEEPGQPEQQIPEGRRHDAVAEILGQAFDRGARDPAPSRLSGSRPTIWLTASLPEMSPPWISAVPTAATWSKRLRCASSTPIMKASAAAPTRLVRHAH